MIFALYLFIYLLTFSYFQNIFIRLLAPTWSIGWMSNVMCQKSNVKRKTSKFKCQMPKVNKVKILSERTSVAPPGISLFDSIWKEFCNICFWYVFKRRPFCVKYQCWVTCRSQIKHLAFGRRFMHFIGPEPNHFQEMEILSKKMHCWWEKDLGWHN